MSKPVDRLSLLWMVARQTNRRLQTSPAASSPQLPTPTYDADNAVSCPAVGPIRSQLADDPQFAKVLADFVSRLPDRTVELDRLTKLGTAKHLAEATHKLRGAAGTYGLTEISASAGLVEDHLLAGNAVADVADEVNSLIQLIRRVDGYDRTIEKELPKLQS
jgi:HPt (histidine-containing phosphotransfer) domain-containing protein